MTVTGPAAAVVVMPAGSGAHATHKISSCGRYTVRSAYQFRLPGARSSISRYRGSSPAPRIRTATCHASRTPHSTAAAASGQRRAGTPCPMEATKLAAPATAIPAPQATSMRLCLPVLTPTTKVAASSATSAQPVMSAVSQNIGSPSSAASPPGSGPRPSGPPRTPARRPPGTAATSGPAPGR